MTSNSMAVPLLASKGVSKHVAPVDVSISKYLLVTTRRSTPRVSGGRPRCGRSAVMQQIMDLKRGWLGLEAV